jgi:hypothetical protein
MVEWVVRRTDHEHPNLIAWRRLHSVTATWRIDVPRMVYGRVGPARVASGWQDHQHDHTEEQTDDQAGTAGALPSCPGHPWRA